MAGVDEERANYPVGASRWRKENNWRRQLEVSIFMVGEYCLLVWKMIRMEERMGRWNLMGERNVVVEVQDI